MGLVLLLTGCLMSVDAFSLEQGYLRTYTQRGGRYGVYSASKNLQYGFTKARWHSGGAGDVCVKLLDGKEDCRTGGHLTPGLRTIIARSRGFRNAEYHTYTGGPGY